MPTTLHDREQAFEAKFARDEEFLLLVVTRRDELLARWAATRLRLSDKTANALVNSVLSIPSGPGHDQALLGPDCRCVVCGRRTGAGTRIVRRPGVLPTKRFGVNANRLQFLEYATVAVVPRRRFAACLTITAPEQRHPARMFSYHGVTSDWGTTASKSAIDGALQPGLVGRVHSRIARTAAEFEVQIDNRGAPGGSDVAAPKGAWQVFNGIFEFLHAGTRHALCCCRSPPHACCGD